MSCRPLRAAVVIAAMALFAFALQQPWARATFDPGEYAGAPDRDGVCLQTQEFTCGAAAAATLLTRIGIRTDEREMEQLCGATPVTGTDEIAVCRALRTRLAGTEFRVTLERPGLDRLARHLRPVLARMKSDLLRDHWVVLLAMNDRTAVLGGPAPGQDSGPRERILRGLARDHRRRGRGASVVRDALNGRRARRRDRPLRSHDLPVPPPALRTPHSALLT